MARRLRIVLQALEDLEGKLSRGSEQLLPFDKKKSKHRPRITVEQMAARQAFCGAYFRSAGAQLIAYCVLRESPL